MFYHKTINKQITSLLFLGMCTFPLSCKKYLDAKPDKKIVVAASLEDAQALLDNYTLFNTGYPAIGNIADDNRFLNSTRFNAMDIGARNNYLWALETVNETEWINLYRKLLNATTALETVEAVEKTTVNETARNNLKGTALFYRSYLLYQVAQYYAQPYNSNTATNLPGIPLRPVSDVTVPSTRGTLQQTWEHIAAGFAAAADLLPNTVLLPNRPTRAAAYGGLARTYLTMGRYTDALAAASTSLQLKNDLLDFNTLSATAAAPFARFNNEVLYPSITDANTYLLVGSYTLDSTLYLQYTTNDLRKTIYFKLNGNGGYGFKASYDGSTTGGMFNGIATDELYLIKAECLARLDKPAEAMQVLNSLLVTRFKTGTYMDYTATTGADALQKVLLERRKELVLRGTRWFDLRRLGNENLLAVKPQRFINNTLYELLPGSKRYTFLLPLSVVLVTGMEQNGRE